MSVTIYGASDDLIEIEGDIREEFNHYSNEDDDARMLGFSDGTLLRIVYDRDGIWRITKVVSGSAGFSKVDGVVEDDTNDIVTLHGDIKWVVCGEHYAVKKKS
jgi:hypothetical protein